MIIGSVITALSLPVYFYLGNQFGGSGLALATSIGLLCFAISTLFVYSSHYGGIKIKSILRGLLQGLVIGTLAVGLSQLGMNGLSAYTVALPTWLSSLLMIGMGCMGILLVLACCLPLLATAERDFIGKILNKLLRRT
jgi:hypothetical protein